MGEWGSVGCGERGDERREVGKVCFVEGVWTDGARVVIRRLNHRCFGLNREGASGLAGGLDLGEGPR